jgi:hypothetical protein
MIESGVVLSVSLFSCRTNVLPENGLDFVLNQRILSSGLYIIDVYRPLCVMIYFQIRGVALKVLKNSSEKYR